MKGEFFIQVNVAFGANSGLELSQETFTRIVTFSSPKPESIVSWRVIKGRDGVCIPSSHFIPTLELKVNIGLNHIHQHDK